MNTPIRVIFSGSGPIAVPVFQSLAKSPLIDLCGVYSQPDRPAGRKRVLTPTPLAAAAEAAGFPVQKVPDINAPEVLTAMRALKPEILCVVSFGQLLKRPLLELPAAAPVNIHASLLPAYRGASPIAQVIRNRETATGVCFMRMETGLDSGPVYRTLVRPLQGNEYADTLELELGQLAAEAAPEILTAIAAGTLPAVPQNPELVTVCRKVAKSDGVIDWSKPAAEIEAMVRAYRPWPGAATSVRLPNGKEQTLTISAAEIREHGTLLPGEAAREEKNIAVGCGGGTVLVILELIPAGGKKQSSESYLNGLRGEVPDFRPQPCQP